MIDPRFVEYRRTRDRSLRNQLVEDNRDLARAISRRYAGRGIPVDDLDQVAVVGLIKAVERFDPAREIPFHAFAGPTIEGELKRHFRDTSWSVRVPRRLQELRIEVRRAAERIAHRTGHHPTVLEIATEIGEHPDHVLEAMSASAAYQSASLDQATEPDQPGFQAHVADVSAMEQADLHLVIEQVVRTLPEREAQIVRLRFEHDLTQSEIAERIGVSQMHVSRLLRRALIALREQLDEDTSITPSGN